MKALPLIAMSLSVAGCSVFTAGSSVPSPLEGKWKVTYDNDCALGFAQNTEIETRAEWFGNKQFELRIKPKPCASKHGHKPDPGTLNNPTLFFSALHGHSVDDVGHCAENLITADEAATLTGTPAGLPFLTKFDGLVGKNKIHTFMSGTGYLRDEGSSEDEPHLLIAFSYVVGPQCDAAKRRYLLSVMSFGTPPTLAFHNGVVHGQQ